MFNFSNKAKLTVQRTADEIEFDASVTETHTNTAELTTHPVEDGVDISDHLRRFPEELSVNVIITNHPPIILSSIRAKPSVDFGDPNTRAEDAHEFLRKIIQRNDLVDFSTTLREYTNMAIVSMTVVRDKDTGNMSNINLILKEVVFAETESVQAPEPAPEKSTRKSKQNIGKQTTTTAPTPTQTKSKGLLESVFTAIGS